MGREQGEGMAMRVGKCAFLVGRKISAHRMRYFTEMIAVTATVEKTKAVTPSLHSKRKAQSTKLKVPQPMGNPLPHTLSATSYPSGCAHAYSLGSAWFGLGWLGFSLGAPKQRPFVIQTSATCHKFWL